MRAQNDALRRQQEQAAGPYTDWQGSDGGLLGSGGGYDDGYGGGYGGGYGRRTGGYGHVNRSGWLGGRGSLERTAQLTQRYLEVTQSVLSSAASVTQDQACKAA